MEVIKILFFVLGTFFGVENSEFAAEKTTVTHAAEDKTIRIVQEGLFAIMKNEKDSIRIYQEVIAISKGEKHWDSELKNLRAKSLTFFTTPESLLNVEIVFTYKNKEDMSGLSLDIDREGNFSIINIPDWNLKSEDGYKDGNYWNFKSNEDFTFTLEPFKEMPDNYKPYVKKLQLVKQMEH